MNKFYIDYESSSIKEEAPLAFVRKVLTQTCKALGLKNIEISCSFVSDPTIRQLNKEYRNIDESTDVLSFVQHDADNTVPFPGEERNVLGDIILSPQSLKNNAQYFKINYEEELVRVLIHGCLHLIGEDHKTNDPSEPMLMRQEELLSKLKGGLF